MNYGYVCVSNSKKDFTAQVIKFITRSTFSHSFITAPDMLGKQMALEAAGNGVSLCHFDKHYRQDDTQGYRVYRFRADPQAVDNAINTLAENLEGAYGFLELPWFGWRALNKLLGRDIKQQNNWTQRGTICSELTAQYITLCGFGHYFAAFGIGSVNAQDIYEICEAHPETFELIEVKE